MPSTLLGAPLRKGEDLGNHHLARAWSAPAVGDAVWALGAVADAAFRRNLPVNATKSAVAVSAGSEATCMSSHHQGV